MLKLWLPARKLIFTAIIVQLVLNPITIYADTSNDESNPKVTESSHEIPGDNFDIEFDSSNPTPQPPINDVASTKAWASEQELILEPLIELYVKAFELGEQIRNSRGEAEFQSRLKKGEIVIKLDNFGLAELNSVDEQLFVRIVHEQSEKSYILVDTSTVSDKSRHLQKIIAKQHFDAGNSRNDGKLGRDVVLVWLDALKGEQPQIANIESVPKPKWTQYRWWKEYWLATVQKPTEGQFRLGLIMGVSQFATTSLISWAQMHFFGASYDYMSPLISLAFGTGIGINVGTYRTWTQRPKIDVVNSHRIKNAKTINDKIKARLPIISRAIKSSVVSLAFAICISSANATATGAAVTFIPLVLGSLPNVLVNNYTKDFWNRISSRRDYTRENLGTKKLSFFGREWDTKIQKADWDNQWINMIPNTLKLIDLKKVTAITISLGHFNLVLPGLLMATVPLAQYMSLYFAEKLAKEKANDPEVPDIKKQQIQEMATDLRLEWNKLWGLPVQNIPSRLREIITNGIGGAGEAAKSTCQAILNWSEGKSSPPPTASK